MIKNIDKIVEEVGAFQFAIIRTDEIPFSSSVRSACEANYCGRFGHSWTCPPGVGDPQVLEDRIKEYPLGAVFTFKYSIEDSYDFEGMTAAAVDTRERLFAVRERLNEQKVDYLSFGCGSCGICDECTYPDSPCRFPEKAVISMEACGINVMELSKKIGVNYINGTNTVTYFCMIAGDFDEE